MSIFKEDRSKFPVVKNGKADIDLDSHKYQKIWHGPQHPGITGNMSLELTLCGDEVVECTTHVGYLHRGFEKLMEKRKYIQCFPIVCRICVPEPDVNEYLFAAAVEELAGVEVPERALWLRMMTLEMARINSLLMNIGGQAGSMGLGIVGQWCYYYRDLMIDRFEELSGGRIYHMYIIPGGVRDVLPTGFKERLSETLKKIEEYLPEVDRVFYNNAVFRSRAVGAGYIDPDWIDSHGIVGPNARAAGFQRDIRKDYPYLKYNELEFEVLTDTTSDIYARNRLRRQEVQLSINLIRQMLDKMPGSGAFMAKVPNVLNWKIAPGETYVRAESSRGEYGYYVVSDGTEYPRRVNVRGPSYTHAVAVLEKLAVGTNIADIALLMQSLNTYPPEIER